MTDTRKRSARTPRATLDELQQLRVDTERELSAIKAEQLKQGDRLRTLEDDRVWLRESMHRVASDTARLGEQTQVILELVEAAEEGRRDIMREVNGLREEIRAHLSARGSSDA